MISNVKYCKNLSYLPVFSFMKYLELDVKHQPNHLLPHQKKKKN